MRHTLSANFKRALSETVTSAAMWFPLGNSFLAFDKAESSGIILMTATTALSTAAKFIASWTHAATGTHFYILASVNTYLAGSILYNGFDLYGAEAMTGFTGGGVVASWLSAAALLGWAGCHVINGQLDTKRAHLKRAGKENTLRDAFSENIRNGLNDVSSMMAVRFEPGQTAILAAALLRTFFNRNTDHDTDGTLKKFLNKHVTAPRMIAASYAAGFFGHILTNPVFAAAQACWSIGQLTMEPERNKSLLPDTKHLIHMKTNHHPT